MVSYSNQFKCMQNFFFSFLLICSPIGGLEKNAYLPRKDEISGDMNIGSHWKNFIERTINY